MACEICGGSGFVTYTENGVLMAKDCKCRAKMLTEARMNASGISIAFRNKTIEGYEAGVNKELQNAKHKALEYMEEFSDIEREEHNSIMFLGNPGSGKTHLSLGIGNKLLNSYGVGCMYMPYRETMTELKHLNAGEYKIQYAEKMHRITTVRLLIIDDLFKGTVTDADLNYVFQIINQRYLNNLPFVLSSEKSPTELLAIDEAIGSRLLQQAKGRVVHIKGKDTNYRIYGG